MRELMKTFDMRDPTVVLRAGIPLPAALAMPVLGGARKLAKSVRTFDELPFAISEWINRAVFLHSAAAGAYQLEAAEEVSAVGSILPSLGRD